MRIVNYKDQPAIISNQVDKGHYILLQIVKRYEAIDLEDVLGRDKYLDEPILQFGQYFENEQAIEIFMKSKLYKSILKQCQKF